MRKMVNMQKKKEKNFFLSLRVFGLLSSSLLLFPQRFSWYVLRGLLQVFVKLRNLHGISNYVFYWIFFIDKKEKQKTNFT